MSKSSDNNIILINLDGLRRDRISKLHSFKSLENEALFFENMNTVAPYTFASLHSIFSGMYPSKHGVNGYYNILKFKKNEIKTITELLREENFFTSCDVIDESVIPKQGFDEYNIFDEETVNFSDRHSNLIRDLSKKKKFFLFLHYTETHRDLVREVVRQHTDDSNTDYYDLIQENSDRYDSYLPSCDNYINSLVSALKDSQIYEKTTLIIFSDHGTSIGEKKGEKFYGVFVYDYTLNVFCLIRIPGIQPKKTMKQCRTIDIFPTILNLIGKPYFNSEISGQDLFELIDNPNCEERDLFVETGGLYGPWPSPSKPNVFCIRKNNKKLIYNDTPQTWEYYDLEKDPFEQTNLINSKILSEEITNLKKILNNYFTNNNIETKLKNIL